MERSRRDPRITGLAVLVAVLALTFSWVVASAPVTVMGAPCGSFISPSQEANASSALMRRCSEARGRAFGPSAILGLVGLVALSLSFDHRSEGMRDDEILLALRQEMELPDADDLELLDDEDPDADPDADEDEGADEGEDEDEVEDEVEDEDEDADVGADDDVDATDADVADGSRCGDAGETSTLTGTGDEPEGVDDDRRWRFRTWSSPPTNETSTDGDGDALSLASAIPGEGWSKLTSTLGRPDDDPLLET